MVDRLSTRLIGPMARDALTATFTLALALVLRYDGRIPPGFVATISLFAPVGVTTLLILGLFRGLYGSLPRYASLSDMLRLGGVVVVTVLSLVAATLLYFILRGARPLPLSVPFIWGPFLFFALAGPRISGRVSAQLMTGRKRPVDVERVLIVGAGDAGEHIARDMLRSPSAKMTPVGFLDDDAAKQGRRIHGSPVLGPISHLPEAASRLGVDQIVIALPSAPSRVVSEVMKLVAESGLKAKILPSLGEMMRGRPTSADVRDVDISDLIGRHQVKIDTDQIAEIINGKVVLVTGAAGSIGSELSRQVLLFGPAKLVLLDTNESDLYGLSQRLQSSARSRGSVVEMVIADVRDRQRLDRVFDQHLPNLVFHAAAYKHVPVMELHPGEAVHTNVTGTRNLAMCARRTGAERFVLVSTDKAVNPTSVMGATKRLAEMVINLAGSDGRTVFCAVRFGNVLASRGSVVPIFAQQVRDGGPITVTHPEVTRYFMTIEEAVSLICQAGALGRGGETFVLEMGEPVKIMDLAERMRALLANGSSPQVDIVVTGLRSGEKLHEDLWHATEALVPVQPGIMRADHAGLVSSRDAIDAKIAFVEELAVQSADSREIVSRLFEIALESNSSSESSAAVDKNSKA